MASKPNAEDLERLHYRLNFSTHAIAAIYNVQQLEACSWLDACGLKRRPDEGNIKDWQRIRLARSDQTDYAIHLTESLDTLKEILESGYLKTSWGDRRSQTTGAMIRTIRGPHPAVCFTDQTLGNLCETFSQMGGRFFWPYGVVFNKANLYDYGARPVIYGDESMFAALPDDRKFLWVKYDPRPDPAYGGYPRDFLHEREWRCRPRNIERGSVVWDLDGVPILLPHDVSVSNAKLFLLVFRQRDADDLQTWLSGVERTSDREWLRRYYALLRSAKVVVFEHVRKHVESGNVLWTRFETLPID